ncbi:CobQ/CobB/MinD/ParA nucleotide binding domain protein [Gimesia panareensis]|uniref:CobQ/CobB/MinD/ParA nucleotide binding domain protein n=1 Tax=Gimesia panareensis TaxID=2527978 RepID=A0A518FW26_9PLAN|nr:P-loop NTPase [Gimesia panareensis]QDV20548.1 CobQ/CobB/MinD/ParA nucleotide binding domain protein [Gimesia panareensis]
MSTSSNQKKLAGLKIGFFGKGGAGKSTAVVLMARALARAGYTVCIVDADSTNFGLHQALGMEQPPAPLLDHFGGMIFSGGRISCPVDDPTPIPGAEISLDSFPQEYYTQGENEVYLMSGGKLGAAGAGAGCDGPIAKIARDIHVSRQTSPVVTLVDFKAGFEDTARGVVTGLDLAIVIVDPTQASLALATNMQQMVENMHAGQLPATRHLESPDLVADANRLFQESSLSKVLFILNKITDEKTERFLRQRLSASNIQPIGVIHHDPGFTEAWLTGTTIDDSKTRSDVDLMLQQLEASVTDAESGQPVSNRDR